MFEVPDLSDPMKKYPGSLYGSGMPTARRTGSPFCKSETALPLPCKTQAAIPAAVV